MSLSYTTRTLHTRILSNASLRSLPKRALSTASTPTRNPISTGLYAAALTATTGLFLVYYFDARSALHRYVVTPAIRNVLDAEAGQKVAVKALRSGLGPRDVVVDDAALKTELWGKELKNPVGLAAGFDKNGEAIDGLLNLGFSWVEIGSVTPKPQPGNPTPRVFHLPEDYALINRYGFPSQGHAAVVSRLNARDGNPEGTILAVNLGKNKQSPADSADDFVAGVRTFASKADVLVVNVSSPNTPGLRGLQTRKHLDNLLTQVVGARDQYSTASHRPKLLLKIAPDLSESELVDVAQSVREKGVDGVIVSNTTIQRPASLINANKSETGGLSGPPLKQLSLSALRVLRTNLPAEVPIIGCGGISTGADALEFARAGASLVQVYTAFGYDGPGAVRRIKDEIVQELRKEGKTWKQVVDEGVRKNAWKQPKGNEAISMLIKEAEHLRDLVDQLREKM